MPLTDKWTRSTIRTAARHALQDPNRKFWSNEELNEYIGDWQGQLQEEFEFKWATSTFTTSTSTLTLASSLPTMMRPDGVYWNNQRLVPRSIQELELVNRDWRTVPTRPEPIVVFQDDARTISFWPTPSQTGTIVVEYPKILTFATDTSTMETPAWTRYSAVPYVCYRSFLRVGPNHDPRIALRYKARYMRMKDQYRSQMVNYFPEKYPILTFATTYERDILEPQPVTWDSA
jgi:hypothetical protein